MKKKIVILYSIILCFLSANSIAQSIVQTNKKWMYAIGEDIPYYKITRHDCLTIGSDTLISDITYYKLNELYNCSPENAILKGFIRETSTYQVYYLPINEDKELLLYDFNIQINDSIYLEMQQSYFNIDSINVNLNNQKEYFLHSKNNSMKWIETIGSDIGLLMENIVGGIQIYTCCFYNNEIIYQNPAFNECTITTNINQIFKTNLIEISSCGYSLKILINSYQTGQIDFYSINGYRIMTNKINSNETQICLPTSGLFIYKFINDKGETQIGKVMVQ